MLARSAALFSSPGTRRLPATAWVSFLSTKPETKEPRAVTVDEGSLAFDALVRSGMGAALKPREVVEQLDKHIIGQEDAKRAVAIALRQRWRRQHLPESMKVEVMPKNILMIGPTGCGKTEIARRIAKLSQAPFIKVEATKFTEVGFHGRDVDQIIRDLVEVSINLTKKAKMEELREESRVATEERLLDILTGVKGAEMGREPFRELMREGTLDDRPVEIEVPVGQQERGGGLSVHFDSQSIAEALSRGLQGRSSGRGRTEKRKVPLKDAYATIEEQELEKLINMADIEKEAIQAVEENGIVFIDEIDKICNASDYRGADASAEGVQRDLLPLIEGCTVSTKHGNINTDYILFIGSGAFHQSKPSDLLAELQGRLPIRVELQGLDEHALYRILTEPVASFIQQQKELLKTEDIDLVFTDGAVKEIARVAAMLNETVENIGARRLHTVIERIVEEVSFDAPETAPGTRVVIDRALVRRRVSDMLVKSDMSKYIL